MSLNNMSRYYKFSDYFKNTGYTERVYKVTVDAGFSCPNRDGKISREGCIYCNNEGFNPNIRRPASSIEEQIAEGVEILRDRKKAGKFIVYFQAFTNTYASADRLKEIYDTIKNFRDVVGLSIATRPDCVDEDIIGLIGSYTRHYDVWIEYGLQTIHNETLRKINRGHSYADFLKAVDITRRHSGIKICAHMILGLPFEDEAMIINSAREIGKFKFEGIKLHPLHVIRNTTLEKLYNDKAFKVLNLDEYVGLAVRYLECIHPQTVIQRISADCSGDLLAAPEWIRDKSKVLSAIDKELEERDTRQGRLYETV